MPRHLSLNIEKPAAGGRMIARHEGQIVLVSGAIPGERVTAEVEQVRGGVMYARTGSVESASPDRRAPQHDAACGGSVYSHIAYPRQRTLKGEIVADAFRRIGRITLERDVLVAGSPEQGYRMRARLHARGGHIGFFREGTHALCDPASTGQLLPETSAVLRAMADRLKTGDTSPVREIELTENRDASERAVLLELAPGAAGKARQVLSSVDVEGLYGLVVFPPDDPDRTASRGRPWVTDTLTPAADVDGGKVTLRRHVASFFQGNRYLLETLVQTVVARVPHGPLVDLYAGAGLFGLACAAAGRGPVDAVESDRHGSQDLSFNARPFGASVAVHACSVETYLAKRGVNAGASVLVDPPRTGLSREVAEALGASPAARLVYVSCDVATLARDIRRWVETGRWTLSSVEAFDLFPNTAHVETLAVLESASRP